MSLELDSHFIQFAESLSDAIERLSQDDDEEFLARQQRQFEQLVSLESQFRKLMKCPKGYLAYEGFISFIRDECRNILDARPYFRERQTVFTPKIADALKARDPKALIKFRPNYRLIRFLLYSFDWADERVMAVGREIEEVRNELVVMNMPLAIARARIFYSRTPRSHLDLMDLVQIACIGLMSGIDKFVPPYTRMLRGVAIGRMVGDFIEQYSSTLVHFYPSDKRTLYNVNKIAGRETGDIDYDSVAKRVNALLDPVRKTTASEVMDLMSAASCVSMEATASEDESSSIRVADALAAPPEWQPDIIVERQQTVQALAAAIDHLSIFERKLLQLKGVQL